MNEVLQNILSRRSYRSFEERPIAKEDLDLILQAAVIPLDAKPPFLVPQGVFRLRIARLRLVPRFCRINNGDDCYNTIVVVLGDAVIRPGPDRCFPGH